MNISNMSLGKVKFLVIFTITNIFKYIGWSLLFTIFEDWFNRLFTIFESGFKSMHIQILFLKKSAFHTSRVIREYSTILCRGGLKIKR